MKTTVFFISIYMLLSSFSAVANPYTLTDNDVVVENGKLINCSDTFAEKDIVIPEKLDGQTVTSIGKKSFEGKYIKSLILPNTITHIDDLAFYRNKLVTLDLSGHTELQEIGQNAFGGSELISIDLSDCSSLKKIAWHAFYSNELNELNLKGCSALTTIGENAFSDNHLTSLDLSSCTSLILIKAEAFNGDKLKSFKLPKPKIEGKKFAYWVDRQGNKYKAKQSINVIWKQYAVVFE